MKALWYRLLQLFSLMLCLFLFRLRLSGREHVPKTGGALLVANHQSYLDPVLVGAGLRRRLNYLAREELFDFAPFRWLIASLDAIPIRSAGLGLAGIKEALRRLKAGGMVLLFPEGTRTFDGSMGLFRPGFCALVARADVPLVPVGIQGAFEAWPRQRRHFRRGRIRVHFGPAIDPQRIRGLSEDAAVAMVARHVAAACAAAHPDRQSPTRDELRPKRPKTGRAGC